MRETLSCGCVLDHRDLSWDPCPCHTQVDDLLERVRDLEDEIRRHRERHHMSLGDKEAQAEADADLWELVGEDPDEDAEQVAASAVPLTAENPDSPQEGG